MWTLITLNLVESLTQLSIYQMKRPFDCPWFSPWSSNHVMRAHKSNVKKSKYHRASITITGFTTKPTPLNIISWKEPVYHHSPSLEGHTPHWLMPTFTHSITRHTILSYGYQLEMVKNYLGSITHLCKHLTYFGALPRKSSSWLWTRTLTYMACLVKSKALCTGCQSSWHLLLGLPYSGKY